MEESARSSVQDVGRGAIRPSNGGGGWQDRATNIAAKAGEHATAIFGPLHVIFSTGGGDGTRAGVTPLQKVITLHGGRWQVGVYRFDSCYMFSPPSPSPQFKLKGVRLPICV